VDDLPDQTPPEVTIEPADNGWVVRHHQRSGKKDEPGRTIRRVASTDDEALVHARTAMGGGSAVRSKKKYSSTRNGQSGSGSGSGSPAAEGDGGSAPATASPAAHSQRTSRASRIRGRSPRRRPVRSRRRG